MAAKKKAEITPKSKRGGRRPGGGRKTKAHNAIRQNLLEAANAQIAEWMVDLLKGMKTLADAGDRGAIEYLLNRLLGKPTEKVEATVRDVTKLTDAELETIVRGTGGG